MTADEFVQGFPNRDVLAVEYGNLLRSHGADWAWWPEINRAIVARWSPAALVYIKERAWNPMKR